MRAVWITRAAGPEALEVREAADPEPGPGQVRIRVRAAGLNFAEVMAAQGLYPDAPRPPCVVGYEVAGVIDALGAGARGHAAGQRVLALTHFGGHADMVCVPAAQVLVMPDAARPSRSSKTRTPNTDGWRSAGLTALPGAGHSLLCAQPVSTAVVQPRWRVQRSSFTS